MNSNINFENEVTVEVDISLDELISILNNNNFKLKQEYDVNDIYMIRNDIDLNMNVLELFKKCVLIRNIITDKKNMKLITYKYKEYDNDGNITRNGKVNCEISSLDDAKSLLNMLDYNVLLTINDHIMVYANDDDEFAIQIVNGKHVYIEIEQDCGFINKKYNDVNEMINSFNRYNIPIKNNDYFVKKAINEFKELHS